MKETDSEGRNKGRHNHDMSFSKVYSPSLFLLIICISAIDKYDPCSFNRFYLPPGTK